MNTSNLPRDVDALPIALELSDAGGPVAQQLIDALCAELSQRYGTAPSPFSPADTAMPRTAFVVARMDGRPVGCGALRRLDDDASEIKRMYVAPVARRRGLARRILARLEQHAVDFGYRFVRLETGIHQPEAIGLYESCGYHRIAQFGPYVGSPISVCYEKALAEGRPTD
jgi:ribosomal protein S18 acetylase RimI-like enzyme